MHGAITKDLPAAVTPRRQDHGEVCERDDTNIETARFGPGTLLDRNVLTQLSRMRPAALVSRLMFDFGLIAVTVFLCESFWNPGLYVLAVMVIGARQAGIGSVALHDGVHRMLSKNRRLNDFVGRTLCTTLCTSIITGFDAYRDSHFAHHRGANTEDDPDHWIVDKFYSMPRWCAALALIAPLTGMLFVLALGNYLRKTWRQQPRNAGIALVTTVTLLSGCYVGFPPAVIAMMYWFVPLATWGIFTNQVRALAEHYPENKFQRGADFPRVFRTRDVINSWFDDMFVVTRGVNYHLSHHLCPQVPFYNLPQLQRELAKSPVYQKYAHVTHGYYRFFLEYFFQRTAAVGLRHNDEQHGFPATAL